jgi:o-succinylbenzoate synthase
VSAAPSTAPRERPSPAELLDSAYVVRLPLRVPFRGLSERETVLLQGPSGWAEFSAFVEYDDREAARWLAAAVEAGWGSWPSPRRDAVPVNATVPAVAAALVAEVLARFPGATTAKVKVAEPGQRLSDDVERVAAVRDALGGSGARIRVDANAAWSVDQARAALARLSAAAAPATFEYAEQPCASVDELVRLRVALARDGVDVLVAADESVRKAEDPMLVAVAGAADVVVMKAAPMGGVRPALQICERLSAEHDVPVVVSSALETSVGMAAGLALAAALPDLPYACGLGTAGLFARNVSDDRLAVEGGAIGVRRVVPDPGRLAELAAPPDRVRWWRERLRRCSGVLAADGLS